MLPPSPQLCQNGDLSVLSLIGKWRTVGWVVCGPKFPDKGSEMVHCHDARATSFVDEVQGEDIAQFHSLHNMSQ
jgi:hypothetical protein